MKKLFSQIKNYKYQIILGILIVWGAFLRIINLGKQSYWMDEAYTVNAILSILEKGKPILDSGNYYFCPLYCYPSSFFALLFGSNAFSFRLYSAILGTVFIILIYYFTKYLFNKQVALLSSLFISFSYWQIAWSREARWYALFEFLFYVSLFYFWLFLKEKTKNKNKFFLKNKNLLLAILFAITTTLTHKLGFLLFLIIIFYLLIHKKSKKGALFILIIFLIFDYFYNFSFLTILKNKFHFYYNLPYYLNFYLRHYFIFIFFAVFAFLETKNQKQEKNFLLFVFLIYFIPLSLFSNIIAYRYLFHLTPIIYILGSLGIYQSYQNIKNKNLKILFLTIIIIFFFASKEGVFYPQNFYFLESDNPKQKLNHYNYTPQPNFNKAYDFIKKRIKKEEIIISSHPQFNKIFLNRPGYWIKYNYSGIDNSDKLIKDDKEYYVNAKVIDNLEELKKTISQNHGYIVFDYMASDNRIDKNILNHIRQNTKLRFFDQINYCSKIWVYEF